MLSPIIRALVAAGATPEMILAAVEAGEQEALVAVEARRTRAREKKRRQRALSPVVPPQSPHVPGTDRDGEGQSGTERDNPPDKESSPTPPKEINPPLAAKAARTMPAEAGGLSEEGHPVKANGAIFKVEDFAEPFKLVGEPVTGVEPPPSRYLQAFEELWQQYRECIGEKNSSKAKSYGYWKKLSDQDREDCFFGLVEYCMWAIEERKKRTDVKLKHLETFINGRNWEPYLEKVE